MAKWNDAVPSRAEQHELKKEALFREAAKGFNRRGFHGTSLAELAEGLGITKAALYHYVPNKHELLFRCLYHTTDAAFAGIVLAKKEGRNGLDKLWITVNTFVLKVLDSSPPCVTVFEEGALDDESAKTIAARRRQISVELQKFIEGGVADGSISSCDPRLAVKVALGAMNWAPRWFKPEGEWSAEQVAKGIADMLTRSIAAQA